jgi:hypothetical protein
VTFLLENKVRFSTVILLLQAVSVKKKRCEEFDLPSGFPKAGASFGKPLVIERRHGHIHERNPATVPEGSKRSIHHHQMPCEGKDGIVERRRRPFVSAGELSQFSVAIVPGTTKTGISFDFSYPSEKGSFPHSRSGAEA